MINTLLFFAVGKEVAKIVKIFGLLIQFNSNKFYPWCRDEQALSPDEQKMMLQALHQAGVMEDLSFDRYEESICW